MRAENYDGKPISLHKVRRVILERIGIIDACHWSACEREAIITSAVDRKHKRGSKHYSGQAIDLRSGDLDAAQIANLAELLINALGDEFDVVVESTHIHIEYDPPAVI
tara:strand:- start:1701 stop:2024 length:324 start_codon:yes stop_codon:yes gene_type:complete